MEQAIMAAKNILQPSYFLKMPEEIHLIQREIKKSHPNSRAIASLIMRHPEMLTEFLNTAKRLDRFNRIKAEHDVHAIINLLGLSTVSRAYVSSFLSRNLPYSEFDKKIISFSINCGIVASIVAEEVDGVTEAEAYLAAMTHNVGLIFLAQSNTSFETFHEKSISFPITSLKDSLNTHKTTQFYATALVTDHWKMDRAIVKPMLMLYKNVQEKSLSEEAKKYYLIAKIIEASRYLVTRSFGQSYITEEHEIHGNSVIEMLGLSDKIHSKSLSLLSEKGVKPEQIVSSPEAVRTEYNRLQADTLAEQDNLLI